MVLVAYLDQLPRPPSADERETLEQMVRHSDNDAAIELHRKIGPKPMLALARRAGMRDFTDKGSWSESTVTAADQARFFAIARPARGAAAPGLRAQPPAVDRRAPGLGRAPRVARRGWRVLFKGGWRPAGDGNLVHQGARLERGARTIALAVLSDGNPDQPYGEETIRGVAARLLARARYAVPSRRSRPPARPSSCRCAGCRRASRRRPPPLQPSEP